MRRAVGAYVFRVALILTAVATLPLAASADTNFWITSPVNGVVIDASTYGDYLPIHWDINHPQYQEDHVDSMRLYVNGVDRTGSWSAGSQVMEADFTHLTCAPVIQLKIRFWYLSSVPPPPHPVYVDLYSNPLQILVVNGVEGPCLPEPESCEQEVGGPIDVATGRMWYDKTDIRLGGAFPLTLERRYRSDRDEDGPLGVGWAHNYMTHLHPGTGASVRFHDSDGSEVVFGRAGGGFYPNHHAHLQLASITGGYRLTDPVNVMTYDFDTAGALTAITNRDGLTQTLAYDSGRLQSVADPHGRTLTFAYDGEGRLDTVTANPGDIVIDYTVDDLEAHLEGVTDPLGHAETYEYDDPYDPDNLTAIYDALNHLVEEHGYDANDRVTDFRRADDADMLDIAYPSGTQTTVTKYISLDPLETAISTYTYDQVRKVVTDIAGPGCECGGGESRHFVWDPIWLNKTRDQDGLGRVTRYEYYIFTDGEPQQPVLSGSAYTRGTVKTKTEAFGTEDARTTTYHYGAGDAGYHLTQTVQPSVTKPVANTTTTLVRDSASKRVLQEVRSGFLAATDLIPTEYTTTYTYEFGQVATVDGPRTDATDVTTTTFYSGSAASVLDRGLPHQRTDAAGNTTTSEAYNIYGQPTTVIDPNGVTTTYDYDAKGRLETTTIIGPPDLTTTTVYDNADRLITVIKPAGNRVAYHYDDANRLLHHTLENASGHELERLAYTYDLRGLRLTEEAQACDAPQADCQSWTTKRSDEFTYDDYGRLTRVEHPDTEYVAYGYDAAGNLTSTQDEAHTSPNTTYGPDAFNRIETITQALGAGVITTTYGYDVHDNLTSVTDAEGNTTTYTPDDFRRTRVVESAATGTTTYTHDPAGNIKTIERSSGRAIGRAYDAANRLIEETARGELSKTWTWDQNTLGKGRLSLAIQHYPDDKLVKEYLYDQRGNVQTFKIEMGNQSYKVYYDYDANSNETGIRFLGDEGVDAQQTFLYDASDRLTQAGVDGVALIMSSATHLPFGPLTSYRVGNEIPQPTLTRTYDQRYRLENINFAGVHPRVTFLNRTYEYDDGLNISDWYDASQTMHFDYDDLSRLETATETGNSTWSYTYDTIGNRLTKMVTGTGAEDWTYHYVLNGTSHNTPLLEEQIDATRTMPVVHDADGNMTELRQETGGGGYDVIVTMGYTEDMNLETHSEDGVESTYRYDADGYLFAITRSDESEYQDANFVYDHRGRLLAVMHTDLFPELDRIYVYAEGQPIAMLLGSPTKEATPYPIITDHLGTPILYYLNSENYFRISYTPFGEVTEITQTGYSEPPPIELRFPGQLDLTTSFSNWPAYYNIHRWYLPDWGRYTQADPIVWTGAESPYSYALNQPLRYIDPLGLAPLRNGSGRVIPYKPEGADNVIQLCLPGETCDVDGVYPPNCSDYPIKIVDGCEAVIGADGTLVISCPISSPVARGWQWIGGGRTDPEFHREHPDWPVPNHQELCGKCPTPPTPQPSGSPR